MTLRRTIEIVNVKGLHARASARFAETAEAFDADIQVARDGLSVCGTSIMGLLMLAAAKGCTIDVSATGEEALEAMDALAALVANRFDEGE